MNQANRQAILKFRDDRNWKQFHNAKDLAISLSLEASELLELFQWSGTDLECRTKLPQMKEELADVLIYAYLLADHLEMDPDQIVADKLKQNARKYPVDKARNSAKKYDEL
ncbi:MAG: nucleotide pyrophosphohydrolase [Oscillospiraceae bacterium]|nr:nucleotide pyrophosphohydrolase [Oscillospiraceae bacterium]MDD4369303.1 nucleotide pyrophosphohydrolase [Oscillospiraceae bacterium]